MRVRSSLGLGWVWVLAWGLQGVGVDQFELAIQQSQPGAGVCWWVQALSIKTMCGGRRALAKKGAIRPLRQRRCGIGVALDAFDAL